MQRGLGDKRAVVADDPMLTYDELRGQVNRAAHLVGELGVHREQRVLLVSSTPRSSRSCS